MKAGNSMRTSDASGNSQLPCALARRYRRENMLYEATGLKLEVAFLARGEVIGFSAGGAQMARAIVAAPQSATCNTWIISISVAFGGNQRVLPTASMATPNCHCFVRK